MSWNAYIARRVTVAKKYRMVLIIHNPSENLNESEEIYNYSNKGRIRMVHEVVNQLLLWDDRTLKMEDFSYKKKEWGNLDSHGDRES